MIDTLQNARSISITERILLKNEMLLEKCANCCVTFIECSEEKCISAYAREAKQENNN